MTVMQKLAGPDDRRGYELLFEEGRLVPIQKRAAHLVLRLTHHWPEDAIVVRTRPELMVGQWHHVAITYDGSGKAAGLKLFLDGTPSEFEILKDNLTGGIRVPEPLEIGNKKLGKPYKGRIDDLRIYSRVLEPSEVEHIALQHPVARHPVRADRQTHQGAGQGAAQLLPHLRRAAGTAPGLHRSPGPGKTPGRT